MKNYSVTRQLPIIEIMPQKLFFVLKVILLAAVIQVSLLSQNLNSVFGQLTYNFTASSGTFTPIISGTRVKSIEVDNYLSSSIPIGFTFNFNGINYTQVKASSNGYLTFNNAVNYAYSVDPLSSNQIRPIVAPLLTDLSGLGGTASYSTTGIAPNRIFTFEWFNWKWNYQASSACISFQVRLLETSNKIEFVYKQESGAVNYGSACIGLAFDKMGQFVSLSNSSSSPLTSTTIETKNISVKPATGQVYTFVPEIMPEPANHVTNFTTVISDRTIIPQWTDVPSAKGYLIKVSSVSYASITDPVDGVVPEEDVDLSDGMAAVFVNSGVQQCSNLCNIDGQTTYYVKIYPYTNWGASIDYKIDVVPQAMVATPYSPFQQQNGISLVGVTSGKVAWGDYNNDGYLDILLTGYTNSSESTCKIYKNNGDGTFSEQTTISLTKAYQGDVAWGDYNNDGYLDILFTGFGNSEAISKIYKNNGGTSFTEQTDILLPGVYLSSVDWGDYNNDGYLDILLSGNSSSGYVSKIYKNNGNGTFTEQTGISLTGVGFFSSVAWGDYNNDGYLDILLTGDTQSGGVSKIYKNNGNGTFTEQTEIALTEARSGSVAWGDYNNDGYLDILQTGGTNLGIEKSKVYKNNGNGTFTEQTAISLTGVGFVSDVAWGDYNNDGYLDILLTGNSDSGYVTKIYKNNGDGTFTEQTFISIAGVSASSVAWGDYDNDGKLDLLLTGSNGNIGVSKIYKNIGTYSINTAPAEPTNLHASYTGGEVTLTWDKTTDTETLQNGLTYNLYVYATGQSTFARTPHAFKQTDTKNGMRLVAQIGNIQYNPMGYKLKIPLSGNYKWSVQAVDAGLKGGSFATEASFSAVNLSSVGIQLANNQITNTSADIEYSINSTDGSNGSWVACGAPNTTVNFGEGGFDIWVREISSPSYNRKIATIDPQEVAPVYTIDYINERTNQVIAVTDEYSINSNMSSSISGTGAKITVTPGQNIYLRKKATETTLASAIQTLTVPPRPSVPSYSIDFINEKTSQIVDIGDAYSLISDMSTSTSGYYIKIDLTPGQNVYFRTKATPESFKSAIQTLVVPARPAAPAFTIDFAGEQTAQSISSDNEYSLMSDMSGAMTGSGAKLALTPGQNVYFRSMANANSFKSTVQSLTVPGRPSPPVYTINFINEQTNEGVSPNHEYAISSSMAGAITGSGMMISVTPGQNLYFRAKATVTAFKSEIQPLTVANRPALPAYTIDYMNETTTQNVVSGDEYTTNIGMTGSVSGTGAKVALTPGQNLYFRTKATASSFKSAVQTLMVANRPSTPAYTIDYINESTTQNVVSTDDYATSLNMTDAVSGTGAKAVIIPGQNLYFRTKATVSSFKSNIQTLTIPNRTDAPTLPVTDDRNNTFNWTYNPLFTAFANYEYSLDNGGTWAACVAKPVNVGNVNIVAGSLKIRVKATASSFASNSLSSTEAFTFATNVSSLKSADVSVYPNPAHNYLMVNCEKVGGCTLEIFDNGGKLLISKKIAETIETIDISKLPRGFYTVKVKIINSVKTTKVIVE